ncbi:uncharacterized protein LOC126750616 [Anthonomus grandis grandis]|uniref:uncharacterized protein LOC126750616 n=1 Tax=Anthonomus grandis grandis TaxID=2921223 RepID=UPI0021657735|nr:uncharacterized protein LOC126750616 [Anthonomus grandis grandis]
MAMQSKLPVRIKRKILSSSDEKQCCCKFWKVELDPPNEAGDKSTVTQKMSLLAIKKELLSKVTQTDKPEEIERIPYSEIKSILLSINRTLENILHTLQEKKEFLYSKLEDDVATTVAKKSKLRKDMKKTKMSLQIARKITFTWPEISRLNFGQSLIPKHYLQKYFHGPINCFSMSNNLIIWPKKSTFHFHTISGTNVNYFQPITKLIQRRACGSIYPTPIFTLNRLEVNRSKETKSKENMLDNL